MGLNQGGVASYSQAGNWYSITLPITYASAGHYKSFANLSSNIINAYANASEYYNTTLNVKVFGASSGTGVKVNWLTFGV